MNSGTAAVWRWRDLFMAEVETAGIIADWPYNINVINDYYARMEIKLLKKMYGAQIEEIGLKSN